MRKIDYILIGLLSLLIILNAIHLNTTVNTIKKVIFLGQGIGTQMRLTMALSERIQTKTYYEKKWECDARQSEASNPEI